MTASISDSATETAPAAATKTVALIGNPNAGKTALFNALTGLRAKTANYPGITVDLRRGRLRLGETTVDLVDLPGLYSLDAITADEKVAWAALHGELNGEPRPDVVVIVLDATNIERNLFLASEVLDLRLPTVVALNLMDAAESAGISIDIEQLGRELNCPVVPVSARTGAGLPQLRETIGGMVDRSLPVVTDEHVSCTAGCTGCPFVARYDWAALVAERSVETPETHGQTTTAVDRIMTRPAVGIVAFLCVMAAVFYLIFSLADVPMSLIESVFGRLADLVSQAIPTTAVNPLLWGVGAFGFAMLVFALAYRIGGIGWTRVSLAIAVVASVAVSWLPVDDFRSLLVDGVIGGVGGVAVFLPQICILFFFISLLEDSGYLARAAFVMERVMRSVGLPGKAFVPMLSAHACAIPGIMAARVIEDWRDRLVTILVLPLLTCSARLPVYAMIAVLLFRESAAMATVVFLGAYLLGVVAALLTAFCLKHSVLRGETVPLVLELPPYRLPGLRNAVLTVVDRAKIFIRKAGTAILLISVILWAMATYPKLSDDALPAAVAEQAASLHARAAQLDGAEAEELVGEAEHLVAQERLAYSVAGRLGQAVEPVFKPLGFDWKINVGVISSFAAREVLVSTLAIIYGVGEEGAEDEARLTETLRNQRYADGSVVFGTSTCLSLLVFYVLAMQCLPTQVVTQRETGSWRWALFQLGYMTLLAYVAALITYQVASRLS